MLRRIGLLCVLAILVLLLGYGHAEAAWIETGVPVCTAPQSQYCVRVAGDRAGNTIAVWLDYRDGYWAVYAQKIDQWGNTLWAPNGLRVGRTLCDESPPGGVKVVLLCNEYGEAIVAWYGVVGGVTGPCAQLLDAAGNLMWGTDGIVVGPGNMKNTGPAIASNGAGGALVVWLDTRAQDADVFIQDVDRTGNILWTPQGVPVCTAAGNQLDAVMTSDLHGGADVAWSDLRNGECNFYMQRVSSSGVPMWTSNGVAVCTASLASTLSYSNIVSDSKGGAILSWRDFRWSSLSSDLYAQRVDASGNVKWLANGIVVCDAYGSQAGPSAVIDGTGGAFITWYDYRNGLDYDVYIQRVDSLGSRQWGYNGLPVSTEIGWQVYQAVKADNLGGVIVAWQDQRGPDKDVYAQRLDGAGNPSWTLNGVRMCNVPGDQITPDFNCLADGAAVVVWHDYRAGNFDIYAQKVRSDGTWGAYIDEPVIVAVKDVPDDEGGFVRLKVRASIHDTASELNHPITFYNVWRRMQHPFLLGAPGNPGAYGAVSASALLESVAKGNSDGLRVSGELAAQLGFPAGEWESVGLHAAKQDSIYYLAVATLKDSTGTDPAGETYVVSAHTSVPSVYFVSAPDSGYSVDNLAPGTPQGFAGRQSSNPPGLRLTWSPSPEKDLARYAVYRGNSRDFIPGPGNKLVETSETSAFDGGWTPASGHCYKLSALDRHGNESGTALLIAEDVIATLLQSFSTAMREQCVELNWTVSAVDEGCAFFVLRKDSDGDAYQELSSSNVIRNGLSFAYRDESCEPGKTYHYRVEYAVASSRKVLFETDAVSIPRLPIGLYQNYPNPFNPSTTIRYYLPDAAQVTLDVYDSAGRLVERLVDREMTPKGMHEIQWKAQGGQGKGLASGVYIYRLQTGKETISKKMVLLR